jgi:hypothetical protein
MTNDPQNKESFRVAGKLSFAVAFVLQSWSRTDNKKVTVVNGLTAASGGLRCHRVERPGLSTASLRFSQRGEPLLSPERKSKLLLGGLLGRLLRGLLGGLLSSFLFSHGTCHLLSVLAIYDTVRYGSTPFQLPTQSMV